MTTSGVIGVTSLDTAQIIELAVAECGGPALVASLTGETVNRARQKLFLLLVALTNRGLNLWCQKKYVKPVVAGYDKVTLEPEVVDLLNASARQATYTAATSIDGANNAAIYDAGTDTVVAGASAVVTYSDDYVVDLYSSPDSFTWTKVGSAQFSKVVPSADSKYLGVDADQRVSARYWKVVATPSTPLLTGSITSAVFAYNWSDLPMSRFNRDTYASQPQKLSQTQNITLQYFFDKQTPRPVLWLWPTTATDGLQLILWVQRQIQDVGDLTNTLDIPSRWLNAIIYSLARDIYLGLPAAVKSPNLFDTLKTQAEYWMGQAEAAETDGSATRFVFSLRPYTR